MKGFLGGRIIFDTSAYIWFIRADAIERLGRDEELFQRTILTAVVVAELYAGSRNSFEKIRLDRLCWAHQTLGHVSTPSWESWLQAGQMMGRYSRIYGSVQATNHFRDALIALEATKCGATLVTENMRDFLRWGKLLPSAGRKLKVFDSKKLLEG